MDTYAWDDNRQGDVDYIAQELEQSGLKIKLDRWNVGAGQRLWDQIAKFITEPSESDAWLLVATVHSLQSQPCKEEFAYAIDRALSTRSGDFPVIGLFIGPVDQSLIPPAIKTRLFVSMTDPDWKERITAATEGRTPRATKAHVQPFHIHIHTNQPAPKPFAVEVRPRAGVWAPFIAAIPFAEKTRVNSHIMIGPRDVPTSGGALVNAGEGQEGVHWLMFAGNEATPTQSYYVWCEALPTTLTFGVNRGQQYTVTL